MDDLPELPFEKVLSYLSLEDRLKARAVSRRWCEMINSFKVKNLCYSDWPSDFVLVKRHWVSGSFAQNFISSIRFESFFDVYGRSVLSNLKHLRLCDLSLDLSLDLKSPTAFTSTLNSFGQLEELDIIGVKSGERKTFQLNLPMLTSIQLEDLRGIKKLTLDTPLLKKVILVDYPPSSPDLDILHGESVECLMIYSTTTIIPKAMKKKLKNLKYLFTCSHVPNFDPTFLSSLEKLKEIHLYGDMNARQLLQQKQQYDRTDLKIYRGGLLLNGPDDPAISFGFDTPEFFRHLTENSSRLTDVIPLWYSVDYSAIEPVNPELAMHLLNKMIDFGTITVSDSTRLNTQRFLNLLKNYEKMVQLEFYHGQLQDLFDQLPEYCAVQRLVIHPEISNVAFLFRLKHLVMLDVFGYRFDAELVREIFKELPFVSSLQFKHHNKLVTMKFDIHSKQFGVAFGRKKTVSDLNTAIQFIFGDTGEKKRKAEVLLD